MNLFLGAASASLLTKNVTAACDQGKSKALFFLMRVKINWHFLKTRLGNVVPLCYKQPL